MKTDGSDWKEKKEADKSDAEKLFDSILFYRQLGSMMAERFRITEELERLLPEDQEKFAEYLLDTIHLYETECEVVMNVDDDDPVPEEYQDIYYDKNTTLVQYLYAKRVLIITYLHDIKKLWNNKKVEEITAKLKETHGTDIKEILYARNRIKNDFQFLENLTMEAIEASSDVQENEALKKSLEEMREDLKKNGFDA